MSVAAILPRHRHWPATRLLDVFSRASTAFLLAGFLRYLLLQYQKSGTAQFAGNDVMLISGFVVFFISITVAFRMRARFLGLIDGLIETGAIAVRRNRHEFERAVRRWVAPVCLSIMALLATTVLVVYLKQQADWEEKVSVVWAAAVVGERFGRLITYALAPLLIPAAGGRFSINFWHPDNAGGLLPFAKFYNYAGLLAAIPVVWLGFWLIAIPQFGDRYLQWSEPFAAMWLMMMMLFIVSFVVPVWLLHWRMATAKDQSMSKMHWMPNALTQLHEQIEDATDDVSALPLYTRITNIQKVYATASAVTTWPVNNWVLGRFSVTTPLQVTVPFALSWLFGIKIDPQALAKSIFGI